MNSDVALTQQAAQVVQAVLVIDNDGNCPTGIGGLPQFF